MDLLEFMTELDIQFYLEVKNMIPFTKDQIFYKYKKWHYIYNFSSLCKNQSRFIRFIICRKGNDFHDAVTLIKSDFNKEKKTTTIIYSQKKLPMNYLKINFCIKI